MAFPWDDEAKHAMMAKIGYAPSDVRAAQAAHAQMKPVHLDAGHEALSQDALGEVQSFRHEVWLGRSLRGRIVL